MSKQKFASGGGAKSRQHWSRCISTLPGNKPVLWTGAALIFSVAAVGFIAVVSKVTSLRPVQAPSAFAKTFDEFESGESVAPTLSVRPVAPTVISRPAEPAQQTVATAATTGTANADVPAAWPRLAAQPELPNAWPRTTAKASAANASAAPLDCLPEALRTVLSALEARFSSIKIVSTTQLHTANHSAGSARANMHSACKAVDIKTAHETKEVLAFLRARPEVGGINSYRNNVIHFDLNAGYRTASRSQ
jgi:hypothetical protein